jgi:glycosyltransferase involved in cell wall biosynthesis
MSAASATVGVSFVIPVHNGRRWLPEVLAAIEAQRDGRPFEIIAVDDGGADGSSRWLRAQAAAGRLTLVTGPRRGAAAAVNAGIRAATHSIICQVDQDVVLGPGWLARLLSALDEPDVAAAQGHYVTAPNARFWARMTGRDLELRYARIRGRDVDHVCTGNTAYRASALHAVGLLDEELGYGYDNDLSYRLIAAGHRLAFVRDAKSVHHWREDWAGYLRQQFGVGYGRLDVIARHPSRTAGDRVSGALMIAHAPLMLAACVCAALSVVAMLLDASALLPATAGGAIAGALLLERLTAGVAAFRRTGDRVALAFPVAHLIRDAAWAAAIVLWCARRITKRRPSPLHSMRRRSSAVIAPAGRRADDLQPHVLLAIVPAFNEGANLPRVVRELRAQAPLIDILIVNDGSTDETGELLPRLGVQWLTLPQRVGVGGAVRAGLRYAERRGYRFVVRIDGDGQHRPCDIGRLLAPVKAGRADAVIGSRFMHRRRWSPRALRTAQTALAICLTMLTRQRITDPTSGFCVFGPRAVSLLGRHHPTGYAEPELLLLLSRNGLRFAQVPIRIRPRLAGRTSLTPARAVVAFARTMLALVVVPLRQVLADGVSNETGERVTDR